MKRKSTAEDYEEQQLSTPSFIFWVKTSFPPQSCQHGDFATQIQKFCEPRMTNLGSWGLFSTGYFQLQNFPGDEDLSFAIKMKLNPPTPFPYSNWKFVMLTCDRKSCGHARKKAKDADCSGGWCVGEALHPQHDRGQLEGGNSVTNFLLQTRPQLRLLPF